MTYPSDAQLSSTAFHPIPGTSIAALGRIVQVVLGVSALVAVYQVFAIMHEHSLAGQLLDHAGSVTLSRAQNADNAVNDRGQLALAVLVLAALVFLVWFWRARTNAQGFDPHAHRRARAWAFWGWVCPVVSLWFPHQIATDILRASDEPSYGRTPGYRHYGLVTAWWLSFVLYEVLNRVVAAHGSDTLNELRGRLEVDLAACVVQVIAAVLAIAVVGRITSSEERRRAQLLGGAARA